MKRVIIACVLFLCVIGVSISSYMFVDKAAKELAYQIREADEVIQEGDSVKCSEMIYDSYKRWKEKEKVIGCIIKHQEMDDIESLYIKTLQNAINGDRNEYLVYSKELYGLILHLIDLEKPSIKNVF